MKIYKLGFLIAATVVAFLSCQKELKFDDNGVSAGVFKKDAAGDCAPVTVTGIFKVDSTLTNALYVDVQVTVTTPGTFDIRTDTINGYSFSKAGSVVFGTNTIRLYPSGKPIAAGTNTFTVKYGTGTGGSTCSFDITVVDPATGGAVFTLGGAGGACTNATPGGVYTVGVPLTPANTLTIQVDVTTLGTYSIGAATLNGFIFSGTGVFTATGVQNVTLTGSGTPLTAGPSVVTVLTTTASTCTYSIDVLPATVTAAVFTLDGGTGTCTNYAVAGTYMAGTAMTAANTVTLHVTVVTAGTYSIATTPAVNGITFAGSGTLAAGAQTIILTATGTPLAAGTFTTFQPNIANSCTFAVTFIAAPNTDYFPLTNNSWWSYTVTGGATGDTAYNVIYGTSTYNGNTYTQMQDNYQTVPQDTAHYRKAGNDYYQWSPTDYYSGYVSFDSPPVYADIDFLRENAAVNTTWTMPATGAYSGTTDATGTPFDPCSVKYDFKITETNTSITVNSVTYTNVIHVTVAVKFTVPSQGITDGVTENDDYYYAKGIGLVKIIYTPAALIGGGPAYEVSIKNYKVY